MKKFFAIALCCLLTLLLASSACASERAEPLRIVCTTFPQYDWVREILGSKVADVELTLLLDSGMDLHSHQPTAADIAKISACDLFIYVGGESDAWVKDVLAAAQNPDMTAVSMVGSVEAKQEETVEGMQETEHAHHHHDQHFTVDDIQDRALEEFAGEWVSLYPMLRDGKLDEYLWYKAGDTMSFEECRDKYLQSWACDAVKVAIEGNTITFTYMDGSTRSAEYAYAGYYSSVSDNGNVSVRYQFETADKSAPRCVQFNDHGHAPGDAEHFHFYFGDESFEAIIESKASSYFVSANLNDAEILESLVGHDHQAEYDEHVWLSLRNARTITRAISSVLCELDAENAALYADNAQNYIARLAELDAKYRAVADSASRKTLLFADRFPFRYLADDYGIEYFAAFSGCSAETEASFETIIFLVGKVDELKLPAVMVIEGANHNIAETVVASTQAKNQKILTMNSLQSVTQDDIVNGETYLALMEQNLLAFEEALN